LVLFLAPLLLVTQLRFFDFSEFRFLLLVHKLWHDVRIHGYIHTLSANHRDLARVALTIKVDGLKKLDVVARIGIVFVF